MHYSYYTHDERTKTSPSPMSRDPMISDELNRDHHSGSDEEGDQHSTHKQPAAVRSAHPSTRYSHHSTYHSNHPSGQDPVRKSDHHLRRQSPPLSSTPSVDKLHSTEIPPSFIRPGMVNPKQLRSTPFQQRAWDRDPCLLERLDRGERQSGPKVYAN